MKQSIIRLQGVGKKIGVIMVGITRQTLFVFILVSNLAFGQKHTQTIRGTVTDADTKLPLVGVSVAIVDSEQKLGASTDINGVFRIDKVSVGRANLKLSYISYETKVISNLEVSSGKELVLDLAMKESVLKMEEYVVTTNPKNGESVNEMSLVGTRSISPEKTKRYTGGMDDPARVISGIAGVACSPDGSSDIIVRGNSPKYMQWRLDGVEISSPYHMNDQNFSFGALTALNNSLLTTYDFHAGAFSAEYGDVLSCIMDIKLRNGNNEKYEATFGAGILGIDLTLEGPFSANYAGSFLFNYRYSTVALIKKLGLVDVKGVVDYQDMTFKVVLPTCKFGVFSVFGLGGLSGFAMENIKPGDFSTPGSKTNDAAISKDFNKKAYLSNIGINHLLNLNNNSYLQSALYYSGTGFKDDVWEFSSSIPRSQSFKSNITDYVLRGLITYNNKLNARNIIQIGTKYTLYGYDYDQDMYDDEIVSLFNVTKTNNNLSSINNFLNWKFMLNEKITLVTGLHNMNLTLNNKSTLEPRIALNYNINESNSVFAGYGKHSTIESIHNYLTKIKQDDGSVIEPNKNLDLLKAHHLLIGYENRIAENLKAKLEVYYQYLYDLPVENNDSSYYSTINEGIAYRYVQLVSKGVGKNYGVEFTLERFFDNDYYFLLNFSLYNSIYKSLEGIWRNTQNNNNYQVNFLCGKEFRNLGSNQNKSLSINAKVFFGGGQRYIPLMRDGQGKLMVNTAGRDYWDFGKAYENKLDNIFQMNLSVSYKINSSNITHELFLDLMNLTDNRGKISEYYDESSPDKIGYLTQFGFFPNLMYRVYF